MPTPEEQMINAKAAGEQSIHLVYIERLKRDRQKATDAIELIDKTIALMEKSPEVCEFLALSGKLREKMS